MSSSISYPLFKVYLEKETALSGLADVFDSGFINEGIQVNELKEQLKGVFKDDNIILMNSCTSALTVAMKLAGLKPGKNIVTSPMTCIASNTPIINLGGEIKWADVSPETGMVTAETISKEIDENTVAVLYVNWGGVPANLTDIQSVAKQHGVKVIQDAAHAFMAEFDGKPINHFADFTCYSFQAIKHFTCGDGGALVCQSDRDYHAAQKLKWFGYDREKAKDEKGNWKAQQADADIQEGDVGFKFNMNNVSAAIGLAQLPKMPEIVAQHRDNAATYDKAFAQSSKIRPINRVQGSNPSFWVYTCILDNSVDRDKFIDKLASEGIHSGQVHVPNDDYSCFNKYRKPLPGVRKFSEHQISIPCGWWITRQDAEKIAHTVLTLLGEK
ncbi:DegT/DnrJ/EryC1/StrS family aminotransferase [Thalassospira lucentensis]|uniref:DegT/DnrJ/EryC1/StrS family aminotransferase n=1 Tax=Thalassospira lucentensis TaxID=168935 RepID=UPI00142D5847|nr:aminotransferase class V-fold PLP-dependent enzyme [Thalassospira lucentensis]NIZ00158.1 aminotransferase class V-fold PLP-dependent enzyme [Thalassospira lucentensis]